METLKSQRELCTHNWRLDMSLYAKAMVDHFNRNLQVSGNMSVSLTKISQVGYDPHQYHYYFDNGASSSGVSEIEEEESSDLFEIEEGLPPLEPIKEELFEGSLFSFDVFESDQADYIYVGVGKSESSMDALQWTLKHAVNPTTIVYLIHVFPEIKQIPSPLGNLPKSHVNPEQVENYMAQERGKRRELLQKYIHTCSNSEVKVDTMLVESDTVAKALLDLIPILNIRKLVVGTTKSSLRKSKSRRGSGIGIADQLLHNAPDTCEIKIVCEGKEVIDRIIDLPSPSPSPRGNHQSQSPRASLEENQSNNSAACLCFKSKFI